MKNWIHSISLLFLVFSLNSFEIYSQVTLCLGADATICPGQGFTINDCNSASLTEKTQNLSLMNGKYFDLLGREIKDIATYSINSLYIKNGRKFIKTQ